MKKYEDSMDKAVDWLLKRQKEDGSFRPVEQGIGCYYKAPYALASRGRTLEALKLLNWIRENIQTEEGDFAGPYPRGIHENIYPYANSWLTVGAHTLGQFDISNKGISFLLKMQDPNAGGFFSKLKDVNKLKDDKRTGENTYDKEGKATAEGIMNTMCSAMAGIACIYTGKINKAKLTAEFFEKTYEEQPALNERFYFVYHNKNGLVKDFPDDDSQGYVIQYEKTKQHYFNLGISAAFLSSLYLVTEENKYLDLAQKYIDIIKRCADDRFTTPQSGKIGWGAAYLALITGKNEYKEMAGEVANYLIESQDSKGCWHNIGPEEDEFVTLDITAEFIALLNEMMRALV